MRTRHPFDLPTVGFFIEIPEANERSATDWHWARLYESVPAREYVYSKRDLQRALLAYGGITAHSLAVMQYPRFRIIARGLFTLRLLAEYMWEWHPIEGRYMPRDDPWILWPPLNELPAEVRLGAKRTGQLPGDAMGD